MAGIRTGGGALAGTGVAISGAAPVSGKWCGVSAALGAAWPATGSGAAPTSTDFAGAAPPAMAADGPVGRASAAGRMGAAAGCIVGTGSIAEATTGAGSDPARTTAAGGFASSVRLGVPLAEVTGLDGARPAGAGVAATRLGASGVTGAATAGFIGAASLAGAAGGPIGASPGPEGCIASASLPAKPGAAPCSSGAPNRSPCRITAPARAGGGGDTVSAATAIISPRLTAVAPPRPQGIARRGPAPAALLCGRIAVHPARFAGANPPGPVKSA